MDAGDIDESVERHVMILKGSQRAGAAALADHLLNETDNDIVTILETTGFMSDDLKDAFGEIHAISKATQCRQYLFSLSLNPPMDHIATDEELIEAADRAEAKLGLDGQPRAIVVHEKQGRRHAHVVWSRIDSAEMKAINLPHFKNKLRDLSRDLFLDHGWDLPDGLATYGNKSPLNFTLEEWQQAKRQNFDPREIKQAFQKAWSCSDSQIGFKNALAERGYFLAKGDRRGFVALDADGNIYAVPKWTGHKTKDVRAKLGSPDDLPSVDDTRTTLRGKVSAQMRDYIQQIKTRQSNELDPLRQHYRDLVQHHRQERSHLKAGQERRWISETTTRSARLNSGLRGLFDRLTGKAKAIQSQNMSAAMQCAKRDQQQRDDLTKQQMRDRQRLQKQVDTVKKRHKGERQLLAQSINQTLRRPPAPSRSRQRRPGLDLTL